MSLLDKVFGKKTANDSPSGLDDVESVADQPKEDIDLVSHVRTKVEESRSSSSRVSHEGIWLTNIAYLLGFYGVYFDTTLRQYQPSQNNNTSYLKTNKVSVNRILPTTQNRLSRLCKDPPKYDVLPNSNDTKDKENARLSLQVLNYLMDKCDAQRKRHNLYMWMQECGHSYIKVLWDSQLGEAMNDPDTGDHQGFEGDIKLDVVPAFEVFPDPVAKTVEECQWIAQCKVRKLDYFKTHYPERGHLVKEEGSWLLSTQYELRINSINVRGQGQTGSQSFAKNCAIEIVYYERRTDKYPNGRMVTTGNGVLLDDKPLPVGEIPLVKFDDILIGGKYFSESIITHLRPLQDQYNQVIAKRADWTNKLLAGKYMAPKGHGIIQEAFNDSSGEIIEYNPGPMGQKPEPVQMPLIPQYAYTEEDRIASQMDHISGLGEVAQGNLPSAGIPAVGMQFLLEQDLTRIGVITEHNELGWAKVGSLMLQYVEKFYKLPRIIKIAGPRLEYAVKSFVGSDINGHTDVRVVRGSTLPGSKVLRRQEILNLRSQGLMGNPNDPQVIQKVMDMLEFGDIYQGWEEQGIDMAQIEMDLDNIEKEIIPQINPYDNLVLHIQRKNLYRKSDKFSQLSKVAQGLLLSDINQRIQMLVNAQHPELAAQKAQVQQNIQAAQAYKAQMAQYGNDMMRNVNGESIPGQGMPPQGGMGPVIAPPTAPGLGGPQGGGPV